MAIETTIRAYKCETCGKVYTDEYVANICCKQYHCEVCGCETPKYWLMCNACRDKRDFDKYFKDVFDKFRYIKLWTKMVFDADLKGSDIRLKDYY